jgi:hypothetical protein
VEVGWVGPARAGDFIALARPGSPPGDFLDYARIGSDPRVALDAPAETGDYELRYVAAPTLEILARRPLSVTKQSAVLVLEAPGSVRAGDALEVGWSGPAQPADFVTLVAEDAPETKIGAYRRAREGTPLTLTAPEAAGRYELRWIRARDLAILAAAPLTVTAAPTPSAPVPEPDVASKAGSATTARKGRSPDTPTRSPVADSSPGVPVIGSQASEKAGTSPAAVPPPTDTLSTLAELQDLDEAGLMAMILTNRQELIAGIRRDVQDQLMAEQLARLAGTDGSSANEEEPAFAPRMEWYDGSPPRLPQLILQPNLIAVLSYPNDEGRSVSVAAVNRRTGETLLEKHHSGPVLEYFDVPRLGVAPADLSVRVTDIDGETLDTLTIPAQD